MSGLLCRPEAKRVKKWGVGTYPEMQPRGVEPPQPVGRHRTHRRDEWSAGDAPVDSGCAGGGLGFPPRT
jgi:hypothetical protein